MRILVVEDDFAVRETLGMVLESLNHDAILAENGAQAIENLKKNWVDVLLLDLTLEDATGEQVYEQIGKEFGRVPPTVVLSAVQHGESRAQHLAGALYLAKPYSIDELAHVLKQAVSGVKGAA